MAKKSVKKYVYKPFGSPATKGNVQGRTPVKTWDIVHRYAGQGQTACGVSLNNEARLKSLQTNWVKVQTPVTCVSCSKKVTTAKAKVKKQSKSKSAPAPSVDTPITLEEQIAQEAVA